MFEDSTITIRLQVAKLFVSQTDDFTLIITFFCFEGFLIIIQRHG